MDASPRSRQEALGNWIFVTRRPMTRPKLQALSKGIEGGASDADLRRLDDAAGTGTRTMGSDWTEHREIRGDAALDGLDLFFGDDPHRCADLAYNERQ